MYNPNSATSRFIDLYGRNLEQDVRDACPRLGECGLEGISVVACEVAVNDDLVTDYLVSYRCPEPCDFQPSTLAQRLIQSGAAARAIREIELSGETLEGVWAEDPN